MTRPVVVGVPAGPAAAVALVWAADEAALRGLPLRLVHAVHVLDAPRSPVAQAAREVWRAVLREAGGHELRRAAALAAERHPGLDVSELLADGEPARVLRTAAEGAAMVVLGRHQPAGERTAPAGSHLAAALAAHAVCPVVSVREPAHVTHDPPYVVLGVDGDPRSEPAVEFSFAEAALHGGRLLAVHVRRPPLLHRRDDPEDRVAHRRLLAEATSGLRGTYPEVELRHEVVEGHPVRVLADVSAHALCLVVGTRGRGGFAGMLLGSVSQGLLRHARCPVAVVPTGGSREAA